MDAFGLAAKNYGVALQAKPGQTESERLAYMAARDRALPTAPPALVPLDGRMLIGQAQQLIGALLAHGLLQKDLPEPQYLKLWDVVKRQLRLVNLEGARAHGIGAAKPAQPEGGEA